MSYKQFLESLFDIKIKVNEPAASYTTFKIGGNADLLCEVKDEKTLIRIVRAANQYNIPYKIIGSGSNILIKDKGYRGLIIINKIAYYTFLDAGGLDIDESKYQIVRVSSGMRVYNLIHKLFNQNIYGLESFAGIPATIGGALYMNMHGDNKLFGDLLIRAILLSNDKIIEKEPSYFDFSYDYSILHKTKEIVLSCDLLLNKGDIKLAKKSYKELLLRKRIQAQKSAGCIFQNLTPFEKEKLNLPTQSIAYIIDKVLGLKGKSIGGAKISNGHAAFIENYDNATAMDVLTLIEYIKEEVKREYSLDLKTEIEIIGD